MATNFPGSLDTFVNPTGSDSLSAGPQGGVSHATMHSNIHDTLAALEAKVGVNSSAVTSSLDYRVTQAEKNAPVGTMSMYAGSAAPAGWLLCQGQQVSFADYPLLAAVFGVTGGTWNLPDLRQRVPLGSGTGYVLRTDGGSTTDSVTLATTNLPSHAHNIEHGHGIANHDHTYAHTHGCPDHSHSVNDHSHTIPDHNHTASQDAHSHTGGIVIRRNAGTFGGAASGHGGGSADDPATFTTNSKTPAITVNNKTGLSTNNKTGLTTTSGGGTTTNTQSATTTSSKTGLATNSQTGKSTNSGSTGDGTAFSVDVVQPYYVVNFMIRVDD